MTVILTTSYLPPISYISKCLKSGKVIIEAEETYLKQTYRNHCLIAGPNGKQQLTIPVVKVNGNHTLTKDIKISYFENWQKQHWRSIETAYNNSPFFLYYRDYFEPFFYKTHDFLIDYNLQILNTIFIILRVENEIEFTSKYEKEYSSLLDMRNTSVQKYPDNGTPIKKYIQVFENKSGFIPDLSIIDLIFNLGPEAGDYFF